MDTPSSLYNFRGGGGGTGAPVGSTLSAFSAYSLLRNCNYLLSPQSAELHSQIVRSTECPLQHNLILTGKDAHVRPAAASLGLGETGKQNFFTSSSSLGFPHHLHVLQTNNNNNEEYNSRSAHTISPCSPLFSGGGNTADSSHFKRQRGEKKPIPDEQKDDKYFERRRRNNQAAKKSRDARKMREDQIALRATILEHENAILRAQVLTLREETSSLRQMLLQKKALELSSTSSAIRDSQICNRS